jgi:hypothetical protein
VRWEWCFLDATIKGPWAQVVQAGARVVVLISQSAIFPRGHLFVLPLGLVGISRVRGSPVDIGAVCDIQVIRFINAKPWVK